MKYLLTGEETERLTFRLLHADDFEPWMELFEEPRVAEFLALDPRLTPRELCQQWFDRSFARYADDLGGMNALVDKQSGELVGQTGLLMQTVEGVQRLEVGYSILPRWWGNGYALEAARKCRDHAFQRDFAPSLISMINVDNIRSERVALKNGMRYEKTLADYKGMPANIFRIDKVEWENAMRSAAQEQPHQ